MRQDHVDGLARLCAEATGRPPRPQRGLQRGDGVLNVVERGERRLGLRARLAVLGVEVKRVAQLGEDGDSPCQRGADRGKRGDVTFDRTEDLLETLEAVLTWRSGGASRRKAPIAAPTCRHRS